MGYVFLGPTFGFPVALASCPTNARNALVCRHLSKAPNSTKIPLYNPFLTILSNFIKVQYDYHYQGELQVEWLERKPVAKREKIIESFHYDQLKPHDAKSFVKKEVNTKIPTKARLIQGNANEYTAYRHSPEYLALSDTIKDLKDHTFTIDGVNFRLIYASGMNHDELSDAFSECIEECSVYDERDGKNWDSTMNEALLRAEISVYEMLRLSCAPVALQRAMRVIGKIVFKKLGSIKYLTAWKRLSGDWNTSVGNSIISMIICVTVILMLPSHLRPKDVVAFFMGDDYLARYRYLKLPDLSELKKALNDLESRCGITPERGLFLDPLDVTFISLMVWPRHNGSVQFVPKPAKQLVKLFTSVKTVPLKNVAAVVNGIVMCMCYTYIGFEFMIAFLKSQYTVGITPVIGDWLKIKFESCTRIDRQVHWERGFYHHYRLPIQALPIFKPGLHVYHHPVVDIMLDVEGRDPCDRPTCK